ncbi:hemoglobin embryonic subunit alpha-like [Sardina pilchardus]|uniref:hemoglobin embryonic subunit alpha-like n=1 Tax=Sardina pilchardus TaxID=27697 RepID=UPI002E0DF61C
MSLSAKDKKLVKDFWAKISPKAEEIGDETLSRMIVVYPQTKTYFSHWKDLSPGSPSVKAHGKKVMSGVSLAVKNIDDLLNGLLVLGELHAFTLRVDPANFKILFHNFLVVLANKFPNEFDPELHTAMDKFLAKVALALSDKYR